MQVAVYFTCKIDSGEHMKSYEELSVAAKAMIEQENAFKMNGINALRLFVGNVSKILGIPLDLVNNRQHGYISRIEIEKDTMRINKIGIHAILVCAFGSTCIKQEISCLPLENSSFLFTIDKNKVTVTLEDLEQWCAIEAVDSFSEAVFKRLISGPFSD